MHFDIHMYDVPIKDVRVSTLRVGKQLFEKEENHERKKLTAHNWRICPGCILNIRRGSYVQHGCASTKARWGVPRWRVSRWWVPWWWLPWSRVSWSRVRVPPSHIYWPKVRLRISL